MNVTQVVNTGKPRVCGGPLGGCGARLAKDGTQCSTVQHHILFYLLCGEDWLEGKGIIRGYNRIMAYHTMSYIL